MRQIFGLSNPAVKALRSLRDKKHRRREGRFLAEGLRLLTDARESGRLPETLALAEGRASHPLLDELIAAVEGAGGDVLELSEAALAKVTGKSNPQAVCGAFAEFDTALQRIDRTAAPLFLVAHAMRDPGNLGTMLRTADAVGAGGVILIDDGADPFSVEAVRASMGAIFTVPLAQARWEDFVVWLRQDEPLGGPNSAADKSGAEKSVAQEAIHRGQTSDRPKKPNGLSRSSGSGVDRAPALSADAQPQLHASPSGPAPSGDEVSLADLRSTRSTYRPRGPAQLGPAQLVAASLRNSCDYRLAAYHAPCFILVGNESRGLPRPYEDACDLRVTIPMLGRADSLNAAVAGAVLAYEALARLNASRPNGE